MRRGRSSSLVAAAAAAATMGSSELDSGGGGWRLNRKRHRRRWGALERGLGAAARAELAGASVVVAGVEASGVEVEMEDEKEKEAGCGRADSRASLARAACGLCVDRSGVGGSGVSLACGKRCLGSCDSQLPDCRFPRQHTGATAQRPLAIARPSHPAGLCVRSAVRQQHQRLVGADGGAVERVEHDGGVRGGRHLW